MGTLYLIIKFIYSRGCENQKLELKVNIKTLHQRQCMKYYTQVSYSINDNGINVFGIF